MSALLHQVALVSQSSQVSFGQAAKISAALQKQASRDFSPIWNVSATVDAFETVNDVPPGYWPIFIRDDIGVTGASGFHTDKNGQPFALVQASEGTPLTCSHEMLEMLVDPSGNRMVASNSIKSEQGRVNYLVEVCDPCESDSFSYGVNGIQVSDFYTPHFFDPLNDGVSGVRYSFTGAIQRPKQVLRDGYLSWMDPSTGSWWQAKYFGASLTIEGPQTFDRSGRKSWREVVDANTRQPLRELQGALLGAKGSPTAAQFFQSGVSNASSAWAKEIMGQIEQLVAGDEPGFDRNIKVLFRQKDVSSMSGRFDLSNYDDVKTNAQAILSRLADGSMPCDGPWPKENVELFRTWANGKMLP